MGGTAQKLLASPYQPAYDYSMKQPILWSVFVVVQSLGATGALLLPDARLPHVPTGLIATGFSIAVVCLCPGLFLSTWLLESSGDGAIISFAVVLNAIFWFGVFWMLREVRRRTAKRA